MYDAKPIETRSLRSPEPDPVLETGDRVRLKRAPGTMPGHLALDGALGTVVRVGRGGSVVVELDHPYVASGLEQRLFYSYPGELEKIARVGRLGAVDLFADDQPLGEAGAEV